MKFWEALREMEHGAVCAYEGECLYRVRRDRLEFCLRGEPDVDESWWLSTDPTHSQMARDWRIVTPAPSEGESVKDTSAVDALAKRVEALDEKMSLLSKKQWLHSIDVSTHETGLGTIEANLSDVIERMQGIEARQNSARDANNDRDDRISALEHSASRIAARLSGVEGQVAKLESIVPARVKRICLFLSKIASEDS